MEKNISDIFKELFIMVGGQPIPINAIGMVRHGNREFVVLNDMEGFVGPDEYAVVELIRGKDGIAIEGVENSTLYDELCGKWEKYVAEMGV